MPLVALPRPVLLCLAVLGTCLGTVPPAAAAAEQVAVRIEAGTHLQRIEDLFLDAPDHQVVSTAADGTIRFWDTETGALQRTILAVPPPFGRMGRSALAGSGKLLVVAGEFGGSGSAGHVVLLYDLAAGRLDTLLTAEPVTAIAVTADGARVAVATGGHLSVVSRAGLHTLFEDSFAAPIAALDYGASGQLAAGSSQGEVRVYSGDFSAVSKGRTTLTTGVSDLKLSPDGTMLAIGYGTGEGDEVLSLPSLDPAVVFEWPATQPRASTFSRVGWMPDSSAYLSGVSGGPERKVWSAIFSGPPRPDTPIDLLHQSPFRMTGFVLLPAETAGAAPGVVAGVQSGFLYRAAGQRYRWTTPNAKALLDIPNLRALMVADDGATIAFEGPRSEDSFRFDTRLGQVTKGDATAGLHRPLLSSNTLPVVDPLDPSRIRINGTRPPLAAGETVLSWAIEPEGHGVVLGTPSRIIRLDADGRQVWAVEPGPETWLLNLDQDGRFVIAALGDGTIRWYDRGSGAPLLSLFMHADLTRWIAWTEDAHFAGPPEAWDLLQAFRYGGAAPGLPQPVDQANFRQTFHTPDLLRRVLARSP